MERSEIKHSTLFASKDCAITCVDGDGVEQWSLAYAPGRHDLGTLLEYVPQGATIEVSRGGDIMYRTPRIRQIEMVDDMYEMGANPDFKPTSASRQEQKARMMMKKLDEKQDRIEKRMNAMAELEQRRDKNAVIDEDDPQGDEQSRDKKPKKRPKKDADIGEAISEDQVDPQPETTE